MGKRADKRSLTQQGARAPQRAGRSSARQGSAASPARMAALECVRALRVREAFAQDVMARVIDCSSMTREDRAFATRLVLGVVSTRGVLDDVLNRCMHSPKDVTDNVRDALEISTYEIIFLGKSAHAAVDQGVELVRSVAPKAAGLANAVLRKVVGAKAAFPFGDAESDLAAYARLEGFPLWLAERLASDLGAEPARAFMAASNEPAPLFVAVNAVRARDEDVVAVLGDAGAEPEPVSVNGVPVEGCYKLKDARALVDEHAYRLIEEGRMLVSDAASQAVALRVLPSEAHEAPASLLEIGAGRATKTILLQSAAHRRWGAQIARYVTLDNLEFKTRLLTERVATYGVNVAASVTADAVDLDVHVGDERFDVVFIDAPCTGLGTLRRHPEIRWRLTPEAIEEHRALGLAMLASAARHVGVGGRLAFATCTVTCDENDAVVSAFLQSEAGAAFEPVALDGAPTFSTELVSGGSDAHFLAVMRRTSS